MKPGTYNVRLEPSPEQVQILEQLLISTVEDVCQKGYTTTDELRAMAGFLGGFEPFASEGWGERVYGVLGTIIARVRLQGPHSQARSELKRLQAVVAKAAADGLSITAESLALGGFKLQRRITEVFEVEEQLVNAYEKLDATTVHIGVARDTLTGRWLVQWTSGVQRKVRLDSGATRRVIKYHVAQSLDDVKALMRQLGGGVAADIIDLIEQEQAEA